MLSQPRTGPLFPHSAGPEGHPPALPQVREVGPRLPPHPALHASALAPPHQSLPLPLAQTALQWPGRRVEQKGTREPSKEAEAAAAAWALPPPALGRRPAHQLPVPVEGAGCRPKVFWSFLCLPPLSLPHCPMATSLWISAVMSLLFI